MNTGTHIHFPQSFATTSKPQMKFLSSLEFMHKTAQIQSNLQMYHCEASFLQPSNKYQRTTRATMTNIAFNMWGVFANILISKYYLPSYLYLVSSSFSSLCSSGNFGLSSFDLDLLRSWKHFHYGVQHFAPLVTCFLQLILPIPTCCCHHIHLLESSLW